MTQYETDFDYRTKNWTVRTPWGRWGYFATDPQSGTGRRLSRLRSLCLGRLVLSLDHAPEVRR